MVLSRLHYSSFSKKAFTVIVMMTTMLLAYIILVGDWNTIIVSSDTTTDDTLLNNNVLSSLSSSSSVVEQESFNTRLYTSAIRDRHSNVRRQQVTNTTNATCTIPKFIGEWEWYPQCPIPLAESQGGIIGDDIVLYSGNTINWSAVTRRVYAYNVVKNNSVWRLMDPVPINRGITHSGFVIVGNLIYTCGGYMLFGRPSTQCYIYNQTAPRKQQWKTLTPNLPAIRAAGGMVYNSNRNSLIFISGVNRYYPQDNTVKVDQNDVWELSLSNKSAGWVSKAKSPYAANHLGVTTVRGYKGGPDRHYMLGGQVASNESNGNFDLLYEYNVTANVWIKRANMLFPRGHLLTSVTPFRCGFLISGGASNNFTHVNDVSYYSIDTDTWTSIGTLVAPVNTPICGIKNDYYICQGGGIDWYFSWRRIII